MNGIANTPSPPYYAVIFSSRPGADRDGYETTAQRMLELAAQQPGYLGVETEAGLTISYWSSLQAIAAWKRQGEHRRAQRNGKQRWYSQYKTRIARVERDYAYPPPAPQSPP